MLCKKYLSILQSPRLWFFHKPKDSRVLKHVLKVFRMSVSFLSTPFDTGWGDNHTLFLQFKLDYLSSWAREHFSLLANLGSDYYKTLFTTKSLKVPAKLFLFLHRTSKANNQWEKVYVMNFLNETSTLPSGLSIWTKVDTNQCRMCRTFELPSIPKTSVTRNWPSERVPVLSSATTLSLPKMSRKLPPFTKSPNLAACAIPQVVTTGVEITNAQGHATTRSTNAR